MHLAVLPLEAQDQICSQSNLGSFSIFWRRMKEENVKDKDFWDLSKIECNIHYNIFFSSNVASQKVSIIWLIKRKKSSCRSKQ